MLMFKGLIAAATVALALGCAPTSAQDNDSGYFGWLATGTTFEVGPNHFFFTGAFAGITTTADATSPLNNAAVQCPGSLSIGIKGAGFCVFTDADGDKLYSAWTCEGAVETPKGAVSALSCRNAYTGGTGKYDGVTGGNDFVGVIRFAHPDGSVSGYSTLSNIQLNLKRG